MTQVSFFSKGLFGGLLPEPRRPDPNVPHAMENSDIIYDLQTGALTVDDPKGGRDAEEIGYDEIPRIQSERSIDQGTR